MRGFRCAEEVFVRSEFEEKSEEQDGEGEQDGACGEGGVFVEEVVAALEFSGHGGVGGDVCWQGRNGEVRSMRRRWIAREYVCAVQADETGGADVVARWWALSWRSVKLWISLSLTRHNLNIERSTYKTRSA